MRWLTQLLLSVWLSIIVSLSLLLVIGLAHHQQLIPIMTRSSLSTVQRGDVVLVAPETLRSANDTVLYSHQGRLAVAAASQLGGGDTVVGRVVAVAPKFGYLLHLLQEPLGLALIVFVPAGMLIVHRLGTIRTIRIERSLYRQPTFNR